MGVLLTCILWGHAEALQWVRLPVHRVYCSARAWPVKFRADPRSCFAVETAVPSAAMFKSPVSVATLGQAVEPPAANAVGLAQLLGQQPVAMGGAGALQPTAAMVYAGGQPPAAVEPPTAGVFAGG